MKKKAARKARKGAAGTRAATHKGAVGARAASRRRAKSSGVRAKASGVRAKSTGVRAKSARSGARVLHLDTFSGIAGNMFLAALLDLGLSRKQLEEDLAGLGVEHRLRVRRVKRGAIAARYLDVLVPGQRRGHDDEWHTQARRRRARGETPRGEPSREPSEVHSHRHGRRYTEIRSILRKARLDRTVRARALATFEALAEAEARVHGTRLEEVHFHEVGAIDAIVDVTGAAIGLARLEIERVTASPVALGHGSLQSAHGRLPLPAPATLELLRGVPTVPAHVAWETVTPTGAAILRTCVDEFRTLPAMTPEAIGHGAGQDRPGPMPNVLRAVLGRGAGFAADRIAVLETHLDDLVPEHFDYLMERLFEAGALDVSLQHLQMKKNRPGFGVRVLARPADRLALAGILFAESTAIGVRATESDRLLLQRETRTVETRFGRIGVKRVWDGSGRAVVSAEYEDCKRAARKAGVPLRDVVRAAEEAGRSLD